MEVTLACKEHSNKADMAGDSGGPLLKQGCIKVQFVDVSAVLTFTEQEAHICAV